MATAVKEWPQLEPFTGIYTPQDVAKYIAVTTPPDVGLPEDGRAIARWVRTGAGLKGASTRYAFVDFEGLISMRMVAALRAAKISWPVIRKAEQWLKDHTGAERPFASAALWQGGGDIFSELDAQLVAPSRAGQRAFDILCDYVIPVANLAFDHEGGAPLWWEPIEHVRLNPKIQFGSPCIAGTRVPTSAVYGSVIAGDSKESMPDDYGITMEQVEAALDWESRLVSDPGKRESSPFKQYGDWGCAYSTPSRAAYSEWRSDGLMRNLVPWLRTAPVSLM